MTRLAGPRRPAGTDWHLRRADDGTLTDAATGGDDAAAAELHRRHAGTMRRVCLAVCRDPEEAEDALQDATVSALRALRSGTRPRDPRAWLVTIARHSALDVVRRRRHDSELIPETVVAAAVDEPAARFTRREELAGLVRDIGQLSEAQRSALVLRELEGLSYDTIGAVLEVSPAGAKQRVVEARGALIAFRRGRDTACETVRDALLEGDGRTARSRELRAHLRECADCRAVERALRRRRRMLAALFPPGGFALFGVSLPSPGRPARLSAAGATAATLAVVGIAAFAADPDATTSRASAAPDRPAPRAAAPEGRSSGDARPGTRTRTASPGRRTPPPAAAAPGSASPARTASTPDEAPAPRHRPQRGSAPGSPSAPAPPPPPQHDPTPAPSATPTPTPPAPTAAPSVPATDITRLETCAEDQDGLVVIGEPTGALEHLQDGVRCLADGLLPPLGLAEHLGTIVTVPLPPR